MRASIILPVFAAVVLGQSTTEDPFPQNAFLTQTNSLGVVTGQPAVATSQPGQPAVDTSIPDQPAVETSIPAQDTDVGVPYTIPAVPTGLYTLPVQGTKGVNSTQTIVVSANNSTTIVLSTIGVAPSSARSSGATGTDANPTGTGTETGTQTGTATGTGAPQDTGAASLNKVAGSVVGLGAIIAAFL